MWNWFFVGLIFLVIEGMSFGLVSIWFAIAAFVTMFFTHMSMVAQVYIFVGVSAISFVFIRKIAIKHLKGKSYELDRITKADVKIETKEERGNNTIYGVKLDGKNWEAISEDDLEVGEIGVVKEIRGNKLVLIKTQNIK